MPHKIYDPLSQEKMRVFIFFSGGASAMNYLVESDPNCGKLYKIVGAFTNNKNASGREVAETFDIPLTILDKNEFFAKDRERTNEMYYRRVLDLIEQYKPDLIALSGYMDIVRYPIIESQNKEGKFTSKVLNIHPADLGVFRFKTREHKDLPFKVVKIPKDFPCLRTRELVRENNLERAYKGEDAVTDALLNKESYTQSTCHIAQRKFDEGPIITQSKQFQVKKDFILQKLKRRNWRAIVKYSKKLQETMKWEGDGPAYAKALEIVAKGELSIGTDQFTLFLKGKELPYCGKQLRKREEPRE